MRYLVGTELGVANTLQRHFDWTSNSLWFEDIPNAHDPDKTLVVLGGRDAILNAEVSINVVDRDYNSSCFTAARQTILELSRNQQGDLLRRECEPWPVVGRPWRWARHHHRVAATSMMMGLRHVAMGPIIWARGGSCR